jgi:hypothetical protein
MRVYDAAMHVILAEINDGDLMDEARSHADAERASLHSALHALSDIGFAFLARRFREVADRENEDSPA